MSLSVLKQNISWKKANQSCFGRQVVFRLRQTEVRNRWWIFRFFFSTKYKTRTTRTSTTTTTTSINISPDKMHPTLYRSTFDIAQQKIIEKQNQASSFVGPGKAGVSIDFNAGRNGKYYFHVQIDSESHYSISVCEKRLRLRLSMQSIRNQRRQSSTPSSIGTAISDASRYELCNKHKVVRIRSKSNEFAVEFASRYALLSTMHVLRMRFI